MLGPLDELFVIDTTWGMPGSIAGMALADYGARVVKLERFHQPPVSGAVLRSVVERGKWSVPIDVAESTPKRARTRTSCARS